jgi:hypothetical protein
MQVPTPKPWRRGLEKHLKMYLGFHKPTVEGDECSSFTRSELCDFLVMVTGRKMAAVRQRSRFPAQGCSQCTAWLPNSIFSHVRTSLAFHSLWSRTTNLYPGRSPWSFSFETFPCPVIGEVFMEDLGQEERAEWIPSLEGQRRSPETVTVAEGVTSLAHGLASCFLCEQQ